MMTRPVAQYYDTKFQKHLNLNDKGSCIQHSITVSGGQEAKPISLYTFLNYDFSTILFL